MSLAPVVDTQAPRFALARLIAGQICLHACMAGMRMAAPLLALREGFSALAVGFLLALFALTQVFLALPAGRYADRQGLKRPVGFCVVAASIGAALAVFSNSGMSLKQGDVGSNVQGELIGLKGEV